MTKIDFKKELKQLYNPSPKQVVAVDVPPLNFLMIDGAGDPNTARAYPQALAALYSASYTLKFMLKKGKAAIDYGVMPLEGLWWAPDMAQFSIADKGAWLWTAMIMQPDFVTEAQVREAVEQAAKKRELPALSQIRLERYHEGLAAQIMYIGPYAAEGPTIAGIHRFIEESGHQLRGKHHEIYLSDPRRTAPEKLKTVIRQPMQ
ncbi:MAG TPA: GyrI-like domain-containing protein [Anaerolineae bacterium]|nr:GyrI-like domain-containing protein [Anaerolineae bacterium]